MDINDVNLTRDQIRYQMRCAWTEYEMYKARREKADGPKQKYLLSKENQAHQKYNEWEEKLNCNMEASFR